MSASHMCHSGSRSRSWTCQLHNVTTFFQEQTGYSSHWAPSIKQKTRPPQVLMGPQLGRNLGPCSTEWSKVVCPSGLLQERRRHCFAVLEVLCMQQSCVTLNAHYFCFAVPVIHYAEVNSSLLLLVCLILTFLHCIAVINAL